MTNKVIPPTVVGLQLLGVKRQPTTLVLTFSEPLDAAGPEWPNYRLVSAGCDRRFGTRDDRAVRLRWVRYDAGSLSVALLRTDPAARAATDSLRLTVIATAGEEA